MRFEEVRLSNLTAAGVVSLERLAYGPSIH
jgi:hypothetical protein